MVRFGFLKTPPGVKHLEGVSREAEGPYRVPWANLGAGEWGAGPPIPFLPRPQAGHPILAPLTPKRIPQPPSHPGLLFCLFSFDFLILKPLPLFQAWAQSLDRKPHRELCPAPSTAVVNFPRSGLPGLYFH